MRGRGGDHQALIVGLLEAIGATALGRQFRAGEAVNYYCGRLTHWTFRGIEPRISPPVIFFILPGGQVPSSTKATFPFRREPGGGVSVK
jgi:hypothetical protein